MVPELETQMPGTRVREPLGVAAAHRDAAKFADHALSMPRVPLGLADVCKSFMWCEPALGWFLVLQRPAISETTSDGIHHTPHTTHQPKMLQIRFQNPDPGMNKMCKMTAPKPTASDPGGAFTIYIRMHCFTAYICLYLKA